MSIHDGEFTRRTLLAQIPAAAAFLMAHEIMAQAPLATNERSAPSKSPTSKNEARIQSIRLLTAAPLAEMTRFYRDKIGFLIAEETDSRISFLAGATTLTFTRVKPEDLRGDGGRGDGGPMYHFAFNIPPNKLRAARDWQLERSALVAPRPNLVDSSYTPDVWHFRHWDAHSIFFFDPAFNIVEYIERHTLVDSGAGGRSRAGAGSGKFTTADILYASEIGYVFDAAAHSKATRMVHDKLGLPAYPRGADPWAMGDERGLILCLHRKGELWGDQTATPVKWDVFPTESTIRGRKSGVHEFEGFPYRIRVE